MNTICVTHLVRAANGVEPLGVFLDSYARNQGGMQHELLLIFKGFGGERVPPEYMRLLEDYRYRVLFVDDAGFDLVPYFMAAQCFEYAYFCFLNSYSVLLDREWLAKLYAQLQRPGVGVVGASGSALSWYTHVVEDHANLRRDWRVYQGALGALRLRLRTLLYRAWYDPFPNYFIRTNAILIRREHMLLMRCPPLRRKLDAYRFESGKRNFTQQLLQRGLRPLVVGRDGIGYEREQWHQSNTFHQGDQGNLLVADNRSIQYDEADAATRQAMTRASWGGLNKGEQEGVPPS